VGGLTDSEWQWWMAHIEAAHLEKMESEGRQRSLFRVKLKQGGGLRARAAAVKELEERLMREGEERIGSGRVQDERKHTQRMVLRDESGNRLHWIKLGKLGSGQFGDVYRAQFWHNLDFVAVKEIRNRGMMRSSDDAVSKVEKELRVMQLLKHPNIVRCYGMESGQGTTKFVFLEYCAEGHLRGLVDSWKSSLSWRAGEGSMSGTVVPLKIVCKYTMQLAWGLDHMHKRGVIHQDIKALNILVADNGNSVKLSDLGEAVEKPPNKTWTDVAPRNIRGSPGHWAPELLRLSKDNADFGPKIDVWAFGCVVTEMLTGHKPEDMIWFGKKSPESKGEILWRVHKMPAAELVLPFREFLGDAFPEACAFLDACFTINPRHRPSAAGLLQIPFLDCR